MKIVKIIHRFPAKGGAGAENYTRQLCDVLCKHTDVSVVTRAENTRSCQPAGWTKTEGFRYPVYSVSIPKISRHSLDQNYWNDALDDVLAGILNMLKPDIVHFEHVAGISLSWIEAAARSGYPVIMTLHDFWLLCPSFVLLDQFKHHCNPPLSATKCWACQVIKQPGPNIVLNGWNYIKKRVRRIERLIDSVTLFLAPTNQLRNVFIGAGIPESKILYYPHGISWKERFNRKSSDSALHQPLTFGFVGTFAEQKGLDLLIQAFRSLPSGLALLRIYGHAGQNRLTKSLRRELKWLQQRSDIINKGRFSPEDIDSIHSEFDCTVVPSIWRENRPLSILESFACGNPVLGSDDGGIKELVEPLGVNFLFRSGDAAALFRAMKQIAEKPELILEARKKIPVIKDTAEEVTEIMSIYKNLLKHS